MDWNTVRIGLQRLGPEMGLTVLVMLVVLMDLWAKRSKLPVALLALIGTSALAVLAVAQFDRFGQLPGDAVVFQGPLNPKYANLEDINVREMVTVWPLAILSVILGVYPSFYLNLIEPAVNQLSQHMNMPWVSGLK